MIRHNNILKLRPVHDPTNLCDPHAPAAQNLGDRNPQPPGLTPMVQHTTSVGYLGSYPGSLDRAIGEKVTVSEVFPAFRGTNNRQSDLGSWGPSTAREGRPKGDITSLTSEVIEGRVAINGAVTWVGTAWNT